MNTPWHVQLFGSLQARQGDRRVTHFATYKTGALFAYLCHYSQKTHPREVLLELFWPDAPPDAARNSLSAALSSLRRQFESNGVPPGSVLLTDRRTVGVRQDAITTDVAAFEAAALDALAGASTDALEDAAALYPAALLPDHHEDWVGEERQRLADLHLRVLNALIQRLADAHAHERAITFAHQALQSDPLREPSHRTLMRLYAASGRPAAALEHFRHLERLLKQALDVMPARATQELAREIAQRIGPPDTLPTPPPQTPAHVLPQPLTRFFGRESERQSLRDLLQTPDVRLVTLTGPGGIGKTRLALTLAQDLRPDFGGRVWFVPLADLTQSERVPDAVREAMGLPSGDDDPRSQIAQALAAAPSLLVLDNMEQLAATGGAIIGSLLASIPTLTCLVTSRETLALGGEREWALPPLPAPPDGADQAQVTDAAAVRLFVDRAQARRAEFAPTADNFQSVAALCRALEGIPLALELAAGWAGVLSPSQMLARLSQRFDLLVSRRPDLPKRHQTLRAAIDSSVRFLPPDLQAFFFRLSVFRGGWTPEAAQTVCAADDADGVFDSLRRLQERSLVTAEDAGGEMRFRMLETLREFAAERLDAPSAGDASRRHAHFFLGLARQARKQLTGAEQIVWLRRLERERENLRAAWDWGLTHDPETGLQIAEALWRFWQVRSEYAEGRRWLDAALRRYERVTPAPRTLLRAHALNNLAQLVMRQGAWDQAQKDFTESLALFRAGGDQVSVAAVLNNLGLLALDQEQFTQAQPIFEESLALKRTLGDEAALSSTLNNLGQIALGQGDYARAQSYFEESLILAQRFGQTWGAALLLANLGDVALRKGDAPASLALHRQSLTLRHELGNKEGLADAFARLSYLYAQADRPEAAARLAAAASALNAETGVSLTPSARRDVERNRENLERALGPHAFRTLWDEGLHRPLADTLAEALSDDLQL